MSEDLRDVLCKAADSQLDAVMFPLIRKWDNPASSLQILEVLDMCIHGGLASGFIVKFLQVIYRYACDAEGITHDDNIPKATWRLM